VVRDEEEIRDAQQEEETLLLFIELVLEIDSTVLFLTPVADNMF
jgi:hypothetical protein